MGVIPTAGTVRTIETMGSGNAPHFFVHMFYHARFA